MNSTTSAPSILPRSDVRVRETTWPRSVAALTTLRRRVFIEEQHVPEVLEWDGLDEAARHWIAEGSQGEAIGTVRLLDDGHIGRMAVVDGWRGRGIGSALLHAALEGAKEQGITEVWLDAQTTALPFYLRHGFTPEGTVFLDANIPHRRMRYHIA